MKQLSILFLIGSVVLGYANIHLNQLDGENIRARVYIGDQAQQAKARLERVIDEVYNKGRMEMIPELFSDSFVTRSVLDDEIYYEGTEPLREGLIKTHIYRPDFKIEIDEWIAYDNRVVFFWTGGELLEGGIPLIDMDAQPGNYGIAIFCFDDEGKVSQNFFMRCTTTDVNSITQQSAFPL